METDEQTPATNAEKTKAAQINAQQFDTPRGRNQMIHQNNTLHRETQASAMSAGGLQTLQSFGGPQTLNSRYSISGVREKEYTP